MKIHKRSSKKRQLKQIKRRMRHHKSKTITLILLPTSRTMIQTQRSKMNRVLKRMKLKLRMKLLRQQSRMKTRINLLESNQKMILRNRQISMINQRRIPWKIQLRQPRRLIKNRLRLQCKNKSQIKKQRESSRKPKSQRIQLSKRTNRLQILKLRTRNKRILQLRIRMKKVRRMTILKINKVKSRLRMLSYKIKTTSSRMKRRLLCRKKRTIQYKINNSNLHRLKCRMMPKEAL